MMGLSTPVYYSAVLYLVITQHYYLNIAIINKIFTQHHIIALLPISVTNDRMMPNPDKVMSAKRKLWNIRNIIVFLVCAEQLKIG